MKALICPLCAESLIPNPQGLACSHRHQFDRAKEGYFHLLPVQYKHSKEPGDAKEQLQARRCFLQEETHAEKGGSGRFAAGHVHS